MNSGKQQDRTVCMTMDYLEFDGDSHESSARWFGMTMLFDALTSLYKFPICVPQNDTERVRVGTITDHARHDLAARPTAKFQCICLPRKIYFLEDDI